MAELCANLEPPLTFTLRPPTATLSSSFSPSILSTSLPASLVAALPAALPPSSGLAAMASGRAPLPPTGFGTVDASAVGRGSSGGGSGGGSGSGGGGGGGGPRGAATTLVAERSEMRRWAQQLQRSRQVQRRSSP